MRRASLILIALLAPSLLQAACSSRDAHDRGGRDSRPDSATRGPQRSDPADLAARAAALEIAIEASRDSLGVPGATVVIVRDDRVILLRGFGMRDVEAGLPVTPRTLFSIGSCTKALTALAVVMSADSGLLSLDDSPKRWLPYFAIRDADADAHVTLRDLLSHRTGVPDDLPAGWFERYATPEELIQAALQFTPTARPGERFQYNNYMFVAAGEVLAAAHGTSYDTVMHDLVFRPLGMPATNFAVAELARAADFSRGYSADSARRELPMDTLLSVSGIAPAGGIISNAEDMAQWVKLMLGRGALGGKRLLSEAGYRGMITPLVKTASGHYGLGMEIEDWHGYRLYHHRGGVIGFATRCDLLPERGLGWIVLTNVDDQALPKAIRELVYQHLVEEP